MPILTFHLIKRVKIIFGDFFSKYKKYLNHKKNKDLKFVFS